VLAKVIKALPKNAWDPDSATRAAKTADAHHDALALPLLGVAAPHDTEASQRLITLAREGSLSAVAALGDVRELPANVVAVQIGQLSEAAEGIVSDAYAGKFGLPEFDIGELLTLLNAWHPDHAKWDPLLQLLGDDAVPMSAKRGSLRVLEALAERVPPDVRDPLVPIATRIARREVPETFDFFGAPGDAAGQATNLLLALGAVDRDESAERLVELLGGGPADRRWAARVAARAQGSDTLGLLATLAADVDPGVRAAAAAGLASTVARGDGTPLLDRALCTCIDDPGAAVPAHLAGALRAAGGGTADALLAPLREHPSAYVRQAATDDA
jgi:hypothetical protein